MIKLLFPTDECIFDTHTPIQKEFINRIHSEGTENALEWLTTVKNEAEQTFPRTLEFSWTGDCGSEYLFELSENCDFSEAFCVVTVETFIRIDNLKIDSVYYWRVNNCMPYTFKTHSEWPRFIRVDGALNIRDIGGNKIKQGLLYRGSAIDFPYSISDKGKETFRNELKIKTEIELRKEAREPSNVKSVVSDVERIYAPYRPYIEVFEEEHKKGICKIMDIFADEEKYPIYFHCMGGADRTGMIALFLRALAGESDDDIHTDYELTALSTYAAGSAEGADGFRSRNAPYYREFLNELHKYAPGQPLCVCTKAFLISCGVTQNQIQRIAAIIKK